MNNKFKNAFYILLPIILGSIIGFIINTDMYKTLIKPPLAPPSFIFPIVWSIIYILMGISYYLYKKYTSNDSKVYYIQLIVNLLWSIIFFGLKNYFLSVIWIILLDILIIKMILEFNKINKTSLYLNIPYLIWSLFATYLTIGIYILN